jgi:hypothetical protein
MKTASASLYRSLSYKRVEGVKLWRPYSTGSRGDFYWSQFIYDEHRKKLPHNNYTLLDNGLLVCYARWRPIGVTPDMYFLGSGIFHGGIENGLYYKPGEKDYE